MFRDSTFTAALKDDHVGAFTWQDELAKIALPKLKEKIRARFPPTQVANYSCTIEGYDTSTGVEKVVLGGLDGEFAERVYSVRMWTASPSLRTLTLFIRISDR
jgi:hypothetical protein